MADLRHVQNQYENLAQDSYDGESQANRFEVQSSNATTFGNIPQTLREQNQRKENARRGDSSKMSKQHKTTASESSVYQPYKMKDFKQIKNQ